jgi:hypothetical protein
MINYDWEKEYVAKHSISYSEYLAGQVDRNISYAEYLSSVYDGKNIKRKEKIKKLFK